MTLLVDDKKLGMASFKLHNGDYVVGYVESLDADDEGYFEIYYPVSMEMHPQFGLLCKLYSPYCDDAGVSIHATHVLFYGAGNDRAQRNYNEFMRRLNVEDNDPQEDELDQNLYTPSKPTYMN